MGYASAVVYENFLKGRRRSQAVASGRRRWAPPEKYQPPYVFSLYAPPPPT